MKTNYGVIDALLLMAVGIVIGFVAAAILGVHIG